MNAPRTPVFDRPQLDNLWLLGVETRPGNGSVYVPPDTIVGWLWAAQTYEVAGLGCDQFTSSVSGALPSGATAAAFPASVAEAAERPIYTILDLKKLDVGAADFGPVGFVFNKKRLAEATVFTPLDTGEWSFECNVTNQGRPNSTHCCINRPLDTAAGEPCELCATNIECCQAEHSFLSCSAWAEFENAPGVPGHIDHILLSAARSWNDTIVDNATGAFSYNTAVNLATMLARSVATASNYENATGPLLLPHSNYYIEANIFANPQYDAASGDILFVIAQFPWLFGTQRGRDVQRFAKKWRLPIVWGLGPSGCYERVNQTGGACDPNDPHDELGGEHAYRASSRYLDPVSCAAETDSRAAAAPAAAENFDRLWATASASRAAGTWNASVAFEELLAATAATVKHDLRVSPTSAGRCDEPDMVGVTLDGVCVRRRPATTRAGQVETARTLKTDDASALRPNLMLFFADDLGWGDLACYGHPTSSTPHLDKLATGGLRLTQFYTAAPECSPSRAGIMTGRYPVRNGAYSNVSNSKTTDPCGINNRNDTQPTCSDNVFSAQTGLPLSEKTLGDLLKMEGYNTAACGKWNLGETTQHLPHNRGFHSYFGLPYTTIDCTSDTNPRSNAPCIVLHNGTVAQQGFRLSLRNTLDDMYVADVLRHAKASREAGLPWLYYFASQHVHSPQFAPDDLLGTTDRGLFGDALAALDRSVGGVVDGIQGLGIANSTLTVFTSDHGPAQADGRLGGSAGALKCGKGSTYEGGMRVPSIWHWPGHIQPAVSHLFASTLDIVPTFIALAGGTPPSELMLDGFDLSSALLDGAPSPRDEMYYYQGPLLTSVRVGWHKLRLFSVPGESGDTACGPPDGRTVPWAIVPCWGINWPDEDCWDTSLMQDHTQDPLLFDLQSDPSEAMPLDTESAPINAAIVARAQAALGRHNAEMVWAAPAMDAPNDCCVPDLCRKREEGHGCCGATDEKECGAHGFSSGMWKKPSATSLEGCVALCKKCAVCAFVSYSKSRGDCSWYDAGACDLDKLTYEDGSYLSQAVNGTAPLPAASPQVCTSKNVTLSNSVPILDTQGNPLATGEVGVFLNASSVRYGGCNLSWSDPRCRTGDFSTHFHSYFFIATAPPGDTIEMYRTDLKRWERLGPAVLRTHSASSHNMTSLSRPSLAYNPHAQTYVLRFSQHSSSGHEDHFAAAALSPTGPFDTAPARLTCSGASGGSLFVDDDGTGYLVYAAVTVVCIERLDDNFVHGTGAVTRIAPPHIRGGVEADRVGPPAMFRRGSTFSVLFGRACDACPEGSNVFVFTSSTALGKYDYHGDIGSSTGRNPTTRAQQSAIFQVESPVGPNNHTEPAGHGEHYFKRYLWVGNQWAQGAKGRLAFYELEFDGGGELLPLEYRAETSLLLAG